MSNEDQGHNTGGIITLVSPSGGGKSTLAQRLFEDFPELRFSVSATTRTPREGEEDGVHYHFLSDDEFRKKIDSNAFLEWEEFYGGKRYGTLQSEVENKLKSGYFILLDIEVKGAWNVKQIFKDLCLSIFIRPPSLEVLKQRLLARETETEETLKLRLERAESELDYADRFDHVIINEDLETAYAQLKVLVHTFMNSTH